MAIKTYPKGSTEKLSANFKASEFRCKCSRCKEILIDDKLVEILQKIRDHFGVSVNINSGYRCPEHNTEVGGSATSHHKRGTAADIRVKGIAPKEVAKYAESIGVQRIGLYEGDEGEFVHIGSADTKRFWLGHAGKNVDTFGESNFTLTLPVLKKGSKGDSVKALQQLLIAGGYNCGPTGADGSFGGKTQAALIHYQCEHSLPGDGVVGQATMATLLGVK